jgi:hypothetical protein
MDLKKKLLADFGKDLPIAGGAGQSLHDPIVLIASDSSVASDTIAEVVKCIYRVLGWYWMIVKWDVAQEGDADIEKVTVLTKYIEGADVVTEQRNMYFDVSAVNDRAYGSQSIPIVRLPLPTKMNLPWQLGWFHFDKLWDNSAVDPGLGVSVAYSAPRAKMTVYVYDKGLGDSILADPDRCAATEYEQAVQEFDAMNSEASVLNELKEKGVRIRLYASGDVASAVVVAPVNGFFFKVRLTLQDGREKFMADCAWQTISTFAHLVGLAHGDSHSVS